MCVVRWFVTPIFSVLAGFNKQTADEPASHDQPNNQIQVSDSPENGNPWRKRRSRRGLGEMTGCSLQEPGESPLSIGHLKLQTTRSSAQFRQRQQTTTNKLICASRASSDLCAQLIRHVRSYMIKKSQAGPLGLSFWSFFFFAFLHHGRGDIERHRLCKPYKKVKRKNWSNGQRKLLVCMAFVWGLYGVCMGFVWGLYGVCMGFVWGLYGVCMGFVWGLYGVCMGFVWGLYGVCMGFVWGLYGVCMGFVWGLYGVCMGFVWGLYGVCMGFVWGLYGVCMGFLYKIVHETSCLRKFICAREIKILLCDRLEYLHETWQTCSSWFWLQKLPQIL